THADPVYELHGVTHYAVGNVPAAVPHTSTYALTNATLPYILEVAERGVAGAVAQDPALRSGVTTVDGEITNEAVAHALGTKARDPVRCLASDH
ncbi:MAG TPA: alanine dehydrogenase, partial [bacterium]|nr:alanine dehydrogenase [bacterium]